MNTIALVTGGSRGLGRDMVLRLAEAGSDILLTYQNNRELAQNVVEEVAALGRKAVALPLDLNSSSAIAPFVESVKNTLKSEFHTDSFDYLVNNAGMGQTVMIADVTEEMFDRFLNTHFKGVYFLTQQLSPIMRLGGSIVNLSSGTTRFCNPGYSVYASMKGAVEVFTRYTAKELGAKGIRANVVAPGPIETDFNSAAIRSNPHLKQALGTMTALGRVGEAEDIGSVVAFLCSDASRWVNGQRIEVSGGINL